MAKPGFHAVQTTTVTSRLQRLTSIVERTHYAVLLALQMKTRCHPRKTYRCSASVFFSINAN